MAGTSMGEEAEESEASVSQLLEETEAQLAALRRIPAALQSPDLQAQVLTFSSMATALAAHLAEMRKESGVGNSVPTDRAATGATNPDSSAVGGATCLSSASPPPPAAAAATTVSRSDRSTTERARSPLDFREVKEPREGERQRRAFRRSFWVEQEADRVSVGMTLKFRIPVENGSLQWRTGTLENVVAATEGR
eukprot:GHVU01129868.1.p1 GENE.GHVU01129868.1~~GHVU01129868.1.p1  ORF type:complete len:194 (-),score=33.51 GHVU01129868.1:158-739(-)